MKYAAGCVWYDDLTIVHCNHISIVVIIVYKYTIYHTNTSAVLLTLELS